MAAAWLSKDRSGPLTTLPSAGPSTGATPVSMSATPTPLPVTPAAHSRSAPITRATSATSVAVASKRQCVARAGPVAAPSAAAALAGPLGRPGRRAEHASGRPSPPSRTASSRRRRSGQQAPVLPCVIRSPSARGYRAVAAATTPATHDDIATTTRHDLGDKAWPTVSTPATRAGPPRRRAQDAGDSTADEARHDRWQHEPRRCNRDADERRTQPISDPLTGAYSRALLGAAAGRGAQPGRPVQHRLRAVPLRRRLLQERQRRVRARPRRRGAAPDRRAGRPTCPRLRRAVPLRRRRVRAAAAGHRPRPTRSGRAAHRRRACAARRSRATRR